MPYREPVSVGLHMPLYEYQVPRVTFWHNDGLLVLLYMNSFLVFWKYLNPTAV